MRDKKKTQGFQTKALNSLLWKSMESFGTTFISFVFSIVLARLLGPDDYGIVAILYVFINLSSIIIKMGFSSALIRKQNADDLDYSSAFWLMALICALIYAGLFAASPAIARFYGISELSPLLRFAALQLFSAPPFSVQNALIAKNFRFRQSSVITLSTLLFSGGVGIVLAANGCGPISLIVYYMLYCILRCVLFLRIAAWKLYFRCSVERVRELISFGSKLLVSSLLERGYLELYSLVIGKSFSAAQLAYYTKGQQFPTLLTDAVVNSVQSIVLPSYSERQDDPQAVRALLKRTVKTCAFITFPILAGLAAVAEPLVRIVLGKAWLESAPFLRIFCAAMLMRNVTAANFEAYNALGRSDVTLKVNSVHFVISLLFLAATLRFGIRAAAWGFVLGNLFSALIEMLPCKKLLGYGVWEQLSDCRTAFLFSAVMFVCVSAWRLVPLAPLAAVAVRVLTGIGVYVCLGEVSRAEDYIVVKNLAIFYLKGIRNGTRT